MSHIPLDLINKYNLYKSNIDKNMNVINSVKNGFSVIDSSAYGSSILSISCKIGAGSHRVGEVVVNKDISLDIFKLIIDRIKSENKTMIQFCEKFEAAVAGAYAKEQGDEPPPVSELSVYGHSRLG